VFDVDNMDSPRWQANALLHRARNNIERHLDEKIEFKTWGMAISPGAHYIATCISIHPSESPEYQISSDYRAIISMSRGRDEDDTKFSITGAIPGMITSEAVAFTMKYWIEQCTTDKDTAAAGREFVEAIENAPQYEEPIAQK
jgi:hypothetical protein